MHRVIKCIAGACMLAGFASAQTINAPEGDWVWNAELNINGLTLANSGSTCVTSETSKLDLSEIVGDLNETCSISEWNEEDTTVYFALNCTGEYLANMTGEIALGQEDASFTLAGAVRLGDAGPVTTVINGKAALNGVCAAPLQPTEAEAEIEVEAETATETEVLAVASAEDVAEASDAGVSDASVAQEAADVIEVAGTDAPKAAPAAPVEVTALSDDIVETADTAGDAAQKEADA